METGHDIDSGNFGIFFSGREWEIKLAENIKLNELKPSLYDMISSTPLNILKKNIFLSDQIYPAIGTM